MPQMAPIKWLSLFLLFSIIFLLFNMMNYFLFYPSTPKLKNLSKIFTNSMNWKW
uniref:ATP synthase complex subunit 8 n=1 Tax=Cheilosia ochreipila TaxID=3103808 RepID=A0AAU7YTK0_9MUSC